MARPRNAPEIQEASGAYVKDPQRRPKDIPVYIPGAPDMPPNVADDPLAAWFWNWACTVHGESGVLTTAMLPYLTFMALDWARCMWLYEHTKEGNVSTIGATGGPITSPEAAQLHLYANRLVKLIIEGGLTPASRSKVMTVGGKKEAEPLAEMLARRMRPTPN